MFSNKYSPLNNFLFGTMLALSILFGLGSCASAGEDDEGTVGAMIASVFFGTCAGLLRVDSTYNKGG